jgi:hypothetical protein
MPRNDSEMAVDSFRAPGNGRGRDGFRLTGGLAEPNAVLEQIWNTLLRSMLPASHTFGTLPSEELFPAHRRSQPLKHDLTPLSFSCSIIPRRNSEASRNSLPQSLHKARQADK